MCYSIYPERRFTGTFWTSITKDPKNISYPRLGLINLQTNQSSSIPKQNILGHRTTYVTKPLINVPLVREFYTKVPRKKHRTGLNEIVFDAQDGMKSTLSYFHTMDQPPALKPHLSLWTMIHKLLLNHNILRQQQKMETSSSPENASCIFERREKNGGQVGINSGKIVTPVNHLSIQKQWAE